MNAEGTWDEDVEIAKAWDRQGTDEVPIPKYPRRKKKAFARRTHNNKSRGRNADAFGLPPPETSAGSTDAAVTKLGSDRAGPQDGESGTGESRNRRRRWSPYKRRCDVGNHLFKYMGEQREAA